MDNCPEKIYLKIPLIFLAILGTVGNIISFVVLWRKFPRNVPNLYLKALAVADTLVLITGVMESEWIKENNLFKAIFQVVLVFVNGISQLVSIWLIVALAGSRFIAVRFPIRHSEYCTKFRARCSIVVIIFVGFIFESCILGGLWRCETYRNNTDTGYICKYDFKKQGALKVYASFMGLTHFVLPAIPLLIFSVRFIRAMKNASQARINDMNVSCRQKESREVTITILVIGIVFFVSYFPFLLYTMAWLVTPVTNYFFEHWCQADIFLSCVNIFIYLNSSVNFIIYCIYAPKFRKIIRGCSFREEFWKIIQRCFCHHGASQEPSNE